MKQKTNSGRAPSQGDPQIAAQLQAIMPELAGFLDLPVLMSIELGRTQMSVSELLSLREGAIIDLDQMAGQEVDIYANDQQLGRGDIAAVEDSLTIRVTEILA